MVSPAPPLNNTMTSRTPVYAPVLKPITSGLPSGLRSSDWKIAPLTPSAAPSTIAITTRGRRHWVTIMLRFFGPSPSRAEITCDGVSASVPLPSA
ncbi:hypothetical protein D3C80_1661560 [compost metagenome]